MAWTSPRSDAQHADRIAERTIREHEARERRSLTDDEIREVQADAQRAVSAWGDRVRKKS